MKVLQIGDNDLYGKRFNGHDLKNDLIQRGIEVKHSVWLKQSKDPNTFAIASEYADRMLYNNLFKEIEKQYSLHSLLYPYSHSLLYNKHFLDADIVHLHLIHNYYFNLNVLPTLTKLKPTVWTLHDPWALTGHCVHPCECERWKIGCGECPRLDVDFSLRHDSTALNWEIKKELFDRMQVDVIVASPWMRRLVQQSPLMAGFKTHLIPFGIKLDRFCPGNSEEAKKALGIPPQNMVLSFRVQKVFKGSDYVRDVLNKLKTDVPITLLTMGGKPKQMNDFRRRFQVVDLGWTTDDDLMIKMYNASDIFLMPSTGDTFGMMAMEAMACGKPVIVFEGTALPETVFAPHGGIAVPQGDVDALTHELEQLISNREKRLKLGEQARILAVQHYNVDAYVSRIIDLYKEVIDKRIIGDRSKYIIGQLKIIAEQSRSRKRGAISVDSTSLVPMLAEDKLEQIKSSVYYKVYDRLRRHRQLRFIANATIKPTIRLSWKVFRKARGIVRQYLF